MSKNIMILIKRKLCFICVYMYVVNFYNLIRNKEEEIKHKFIYYTI